MDSTVKSGIEANALTSGRAAFYAAPVEVESRRWTVARNENDVMPAASTIKLLVAVAAADSSLDWREPVELRNLPDSIYSTIRVVFDSNRRLTVGELVGLSIASSDNAAADWLVSRLGGTFVQQRADQLGLASTRLGMGFADAVLADDGRSHVSTVRDMAQLLLYIFERRSSGTRYARIWRALENSLNKSRIAGRLPEGIKVANKTGSLTGVVNDVGIVLCPNPFLLAVFTDEQPDSLVAGSEIADLSLQVFSYASSGRGA